MKVTKNEMEYARYYYEVGRYYYEVRSQLLAFLTG